MTNLRRDRPSIKRVKKPWIERNWKTIAIVFAILFLFQSFRGCLRGNSAARTQKSLILERDSIYMVKDKQIISLQELLDSYQKENQMLIYELKIAGVKADEAEKRAKAIQDTAEKIKQNTTIEIKTDTTRNKIK